MRLPIGRLLTALLVLCAVQGQAPPKPFLLKPYRVLVVVASWGDPASQVLTDPLVDRIKQSGTVNMIVDDRLHESIDTSQLSERPY